jgi:chromosome segregation ATPase
MEIEWLGDLETRVREAVARLGELREENRTLQRKVKDLETQVATLSIPPAEPAEAAADADEEVEALRARVRDLEEDLAAAETERADAAAAARSLEIEREEVRRRVEGLVERLERLAGA